MDSASLIGLVTALGVGTVIPQLASGLIKHLGGRFEAERTINADALAQRDSAWSHALEVERRCEVREVEAWARVERAEAAADREAASRRRLQEYASLLRSTMVECCGVRAADLPSWPDAKDCPLNQGHRSGDLPPATD